ncbi:hypothetical protein K501DRAFT_331744 [Backusella circina FSU 941]|nr:hypothetical protein K501DRAFT_331744 [Backusella circina FSU 941]
MKRAVGYCLQAYKRFEVEPVLFVICIKSLCVTIKNGLENCDDLPCYAAPCDYWANHCYIVDKSSIKNHIASDSGLESNLNPFAAYCLFLTTQATSINQVSRKVDETTKMLYRISQNAYVKILDQDASFLEELKNLNDMYYKQYEKVLTMVTDDGLPRSAIKEYASQSLQYSIEQKRKFDEITSENHLSENQDLDESRDESRNESMDFIEIFKKERAEKGIRMNWKLCLAEGKKRFGWKNKPSIAFSDRIPITIHIDHMKKHCMAATNRDYQNWLKVSF